ncbi:hypothetical protein HHL19_21740 [Streptomyces sp. R302]|uniref:hypothetical protein n=1 Tax=unclassified Streptomyces TaxID=2593676 RepID=UPI00145C6339|nr:MULTISPECIES: hypothetical protein [unclassified Streptomyces]NML51597.1 hypothetical protein [Streptomyces sp. R301]NML81217.1 hypothetical protein [Streptomyces sp. R302]
MEGRAEEAVDAWREAVADAIHAGLTHEAADWLYAIRMANVRCGWRFGSVYSPDIHVSQAPWESIVEFMEEVRAGVSALGINPDFIPRV